MACENCTCSDREKCLNEGCKCTNCVCKFNDSDESKNMAPFDR
jgi:hypothetical protein